MAQMREQWRNTSSHHDSYTDTEAVLWCVLGGSDVMLVAGTQHNAMIEKDLPPPYILQKLHQQ
ncbi:hypothetical protein E2C01_019015 [Portunus trituberculatus]|uniref:Uncharacterized protein n=1 Tax=Portunus trituberculatus TaxID=210409 RepID=A0A5B7DWJ6_PORTR|nr:hypothetical protein [Portunus trituberculatus]